MQVSLVLDLLGSGVVSAGAKGGSGGGARDPEVARRAERVRRHVLAAQKGLSEARDGSMDELEPLRRLLSSLDTLLRSNKRCAHGTRAHARACPGATRGVRQRPAASGSADRAAH